MNGSRKTKTPANDERTDNGEFIRNLCEHKFLNNAGLQIHLKWHKIKKTKHKCPKCGLTFLKNADLRMHFKYDH